MSAMYTLPDASTAMPYGWLSVADVACPPSPLNEPVPPYGMPLPAIVEITPVDLVIRRMQLFCVSAMYRLPSVSTATLVGLFRFGAIVEMTPLVTRRMQLLFVSAMYMLPAASTVTPYGLYSLSSMALP